MFAYLVGKIDHLTPTSLVLDVAGVGYLINISLNTYSKLEGLTQVKIYTYLLVREDLMALYGFSSLDEKDLFILLISVSGVGATSAQVMLSSMNPDEIRQAILSENVGMLRRAKGVGEKTAKQIILDIKKKLEKEPILPMENGVLSSPAREEALSALLTLGFQKVAVQRVLNKIQDPNNELGLEGWIKQALKELS
jgi:holliday junction DNA helicase RuvA